MAVQGRHIDAGDMDSQIAKQVVTGQALGLTFSIGVEEGMDESLPFADQDDVDKRRQRFGIEKGDRPAHDDERIVIIAVSGQDGDAPHFQDRRHVEIVHFKTDRQTEDFEIRQRPAVLQGNERFPCLLEDLHEVLVRQESPFAEPVLAAVHFAVDDLHPQIAHGHVIRIGITDSHGMTRAERILYSPRFLGHQIIQRFLYLPAHESPSFHSSFVRYPILYHRMSRWASRVLHRRSHRVMVLIDVRRPQAAGRKASPYRGRWPNGPERLNYRRSRFKSNLSVSCADSSPMRRAF